MKLFRTIASALIALGLLFAEASADQSPIFSPTTGTVSGLNLSNNYNNAFNAIASCNSGSIAPANTISAVPIAGQCWLDTSTTRYKLKIFDGSSWLVTAVMDSVSHAWMPVVGGGSGTLASASTTDLGSIAENYISITGTATITSFGSSVPAGVSKVLRFASSGAGITYNATSMLLPQNASVVTVAGDTAIAISLGTGNWLVIYLPPAATLSANNAFTGVNTHAGLETFNGGITINGSTNKTIVVGGQIGSPGGRLTLTSLVPVLTSDVAAATTVYYTPYLSNFIVLYDGTNWDLWNFSEVSQALSDTTKSPAATAANNAYDVFAWNDAGTFRATRGPTWATGGGSNTARGSGAGSTALIRQNGVWVNQFAITNGPAAGKGLYVGSFITNGSNAVDWVANPAAAAGGGNARVLIWNNYNRVPVTIRSQEGTSSWSYGTSTIRAANNSTSNRITLFMGQNEAAVSAISNTVSEWNGTGHQAMIGIGLDSTSAIATTSTIGVEHENFGWNANIPIYATFYGLMGLGSHFLQMVEANNAGTFNNSGVGAPYVSTTAISALASM